MFLKSYKVKSNSVLGGKDVKVFEKNLLESYPHLDLTNCDNKAATTIIKLCTHANEIVNLYCKDKLPYFFEAKIGECTKFIPTVYTLWRFPDLLPYFTTHSQVLPKLSNGADLMLPGVIPQGTGMNIYGRFKKEQLVAINLTSNKSAVGVGYLLRSSDDLYMSGGRGAGVKILHLFGDKLWSHEPTLIQQIPLKAMKELNLDDFPSLGEQRNIKSQIDQNTQKTNSNEVIETEDIQLNEELPKETLETTEIEEVLSEDILKRAFIAALKNNKKKMTLPLLTSNFYRLHVVPELSSPFDIKKTKYKKLSNFLNEMMNENFVVLREEVKGVSKIVSVNYDHPEIVEYITDYTAPTETSSNQQLFHSKLLELYVITNETAPFFAKLDYKRGEPLSSVDIKKIVRQYIDKFKIPYSNNLYDLDETLKNICDCEKTSLTDICNKILSNMDSSYQMCQAENGFTNKPPIQMSIETRSGNKKVTIVRNIECYGIILPEFIKQCKQGTAASTTLVKSPHQKNEQLQIQGNQIRFILTLLTETYKIPAKCILGAELIKNKKKGGKK